MNKRICELIYPSDHLWNMELHDVNLKKLEKNLNSVNDTILNLLLHGKKDSKIFISSIMWKAYARSCASSLTEKKQETLLVDVFKGKRLKS